LPVASFQLPVSGTFQIVNQNVILGATPVMRPKTMPGQDTTPIKTGVRMAKRISLWNKRGTKTGDEVSLPEQFRFFATPSFANFVSLRLAE
jgi:hypothetical protein